MDIAALGRQLEADAAAGDVPFLVVGTAGSVSTGAVDPLPEIAAVCKAHGAWFHVDAGGVFARKATIDLNHKLDGLGEVRASFLHRRPLGIGARQLLDVDDPILNVAGACLGYLMWRGAQALARPSRT